MGKMTQVICQAWVVKLAIKYRARPMAQMRALMLLARGDFSFSSSSADELREEALIAKSLLKLLIDRGDAELTVPYNELCSTDDWSQMIDLLDAY